MKKFRCVYPELFSDDQFLQLSAKSPLACLLMIGIWCFSDDYGVFDWKPAKLKALALPEVNCDGAALLGLLVEANFVVAFTAADGKAVGVVRNFGMFQKMRRKVSSFANTPAMLAFAKISEDERAASEHKAPKRECDSPVKSGSERTLSATERTLSALVRLEGEREGEGEGEGEEEKEKDPPSLSHASEAEKSVEATPSDAEVVRFPIGDDVEGQCRERLRESPAAKDRDFRPVRQLLDGGKAIRADVLSALDDAERKQQRFRSWASFGNWVQQAAKDRVAASRSRAGPRSGRERAPSRTDLLAEMAANGPRGRDDAASGRGLA